uniref:hypothetical protein n=1 Tax=Rheinheimera sp. TaxID=1869214 RepID=UPI0040483B9C
MSKNWYGNALTMLLQALKSPNAGHISGTTFLRDYFLENPEQAFPVSYSEAEDLDELVREEIDEFQAWLKTNTAEILVGKRYNWSLVKARTKNTADTSISLELNAEESSVDRKLVSDISYTEITILERVLSKFRNSDDAVKIHELTVKIASWYELKSGSSYKIAEWWESAIDSSKVVPVSSRHKYFLKAAEYLAKSGEYKKSGALYEEGFDLYLTERDYPSKKLDSESLSTAVGISKKARASYSFALESKSES